MAEIFMSKADKFELAVDAIVSGDIDRLKILLKESPELVHQRSARPHKAMLIHYTAANGVEDERQKTPPNIVEITELLLAAGAEVDAETNGGTTLGLAATSCHPRLAGVQIELLKTLIAYGACVDGVPGGWNPLLASLHNGRPEAAFYLAQRGAKLDLEASAGVGRLDLVQTYFNDDGSLKDAATPKQMQSGFMWACEYGRNEVVEFLLDKGIDIQTGENTDMTGLHWAIVGAQLDTIRLLLKRGASLKALNVYGGDALSQVFWCITNHTHMQKEYIAVIELILASGADIVPGYLGWWARQDSVLPETNQQVERLLKKYGAAS
jgi:hypothetical protein